MRSLTETADDDMISGAGNDEVWISAFLQGNFPGLTTTLGKILESKRGGHGETEVKTANKYEEVVDIGMVSESTTSSSTEFNDLAAKGLSNAEGEPTSCRGKEESNHGFTAWSERHRYYGNAEALRKRGGQRQKTQRLIIEGGRHI